MADTGEEIGRDFKTFIPALTDLADVQNAFKMYHFGVVNYTGIEEIPQESIEGHLGFMDERLASIEDRPTSGGIVSLTEPTSLSPENYHPSGYTPPAGMPTSYDIPNGFIWVDTSGDPGAMSFPQVYYTPTAPDGLNATTDVGSLWIDSDNQLVSVWTGAAFQPVATTTATNTDFLLEGTTNLYFTDQRAIDATALEYDPAGSASAAQSAAESYADSLAPNYEPAGAVSTHESDTTNVHGITDTSTLAYKVSANDLEITDATKGIILKSPNGTRYRITVDDSGVLSTTVVP